MEIWKNTKKILKKGFIARTDENNKKGGSKERKKNERERKKEKSKKARRKRTKERTKEKDIIRIDTAQK